MGWLSRIELMGIMHLLCGLDPDLPNGESIWHDMIWHGAGVG
jgi:hypothetical protein